MKALFTALPLLLLPVLAAAQEEIRTDSLPQRLVRTRDGNEFAGAVVSDTRDTLVLQTDAYGRVQIPKSQIRRSKAVPEGNPRAYWFDSPLDTRYFASSSAFGLRKGEGSYQNIWISVNQIDVGITDYFSMGGGTLPPLIFAGVLPVWVTPKVTAPVVKDRLHIGAGGLIGSVLSSWAPDRTTFGLVYGQVSAGSRDKNVSLTIGRAYAEGAWAERMMWSLSGAYRTGKKVALISENYFIDIEGERGAIFSGGMRLIGRNISFDIALALPMFEYGLGAFPWLSLAAPIGGEGGRKAKRSKGKGG